MSENAGLMPGVIRRLEIVKTESFGVYLAEPGSGSETRIEEKVLLPIKQVPEDAAIGDELEVFLYRDSRDRLIATVNRPLLFCGSIAVLKVKEVNSSAGAFLDMGLERDLLLPFAEQTARVRAGDEVPVTMYLDKSSRLAATMKIYPYLRTDSPYRTGDEVTGVVYDISRDFGIYVEVDELYSARIPARENMHDLKVGDRVRARVTRVLPDGKLDISVGGSFAEKQDDNMRLVMDALEKAGGELMLSDRSDPELIRDRLHISKASFKKAIGSLYKQRLIAIEPDRIRKL